MIRETFDKGILKVLQSFYKDAVRDRAGEILFRQESLVAIVIGVSFGIWGNKFFPNSAKLVDVCLGYLGYAAIALGFCVGGVTIALTLPDRPFVIKLATLTIPQKKGDALSGLFFVFCWTAVVHWFSVVLVLLILFTNGHNDSGTLTAITVLGRVAVSVTIATCAYALMQFLITVLTLWQVGSIYIRNLQKDAQSVSDESKREFLRQILANTSNDERIVADSWKRIFPQDTEWIDEFVARKLR